LLAATSAVAVACVIWPNVPLAARATIIAGAVVALGHLFARPLFSWFGAEPVIEPPKGRRYVVKWRRHAEEMSEE
jgi:hypothetical protein